MPGPCLQWLSKCATQTLALSQPYLLKEVCRDTEMEINLQVTPKKTARFGGLIKSIKHDNSTFRNLSQQAKPNKKHVLLPFEAVTFLINPLFVSNRCKGEIKQTIKLIRRGPDGEIL